MRSEVTYRKRSPVVVRNRSRSWRWKRWKLKRSLGEFVLRTLVSKIKYHQWYQENWIFPHTSEPSMTSSHFSRIGFFSIWNSGILCWTIFTLIWFHRSWLLLKGWGMSPQESGNMNEAKRMNRFREKKCRIVNFDYDIKIFMFAEAKTWNIYISFWHWQRRRACQRSSKEHELTSKAWCGKFIWSDQGLCELMKISAILSSFHSAVG